MDHICILATELEVAYNGDSCGGISLKCLYVKRLSYVSLHCELV